MHIAQCGANRKVALQWVEMSLVDFCHFVPTHGLGYYFSGTPTPLVSREQLKGITHMDSTILSKKAAIMEAELFRSPGLLLPRAREIYDTTLLPPFPRKLANCRHHQRGTSMKQEMVKETPLVTRASVLTVTLMLFLSVPAVAGAAELQDIITTGNASLCSSSATNLDGNAEDSGCLTIAQAQPHLEGLEMASDLGSAVLRRRLLDISKVVGKTPNGNKAACGRDKYGRYIPCTTLASKKDQRKCDPLKRDCH